MPIGVSIGQRHHAETAVKKKVSAKVREEIKINCPLCQTSHTLSGILSGSSKALL